jgi:hypothetical protein
VFCNGGKGKKAQGKVIRKIHARKHRECRTFEASVTETVFDDRNVTGICRTLEASYKDAEKPKPSSHSGCDQLWT